MVSGFFAVNVPFDIPVPEFGPREFFKDVGNGTIVFRPREWRGTGSTTIPFSKREYLTVPEMAAEINAYPPGTVTAIYLTSDGGGNLTLFQDLVPQLHPRVRVVNPNHLAALAAQSKTKKND